MFDTIERALYWFSSLLIEGDADAHCLLRGPVDSDTFVTTSDDLMTVIEVLGSRELVGSAEFVQLVQNISKQYGVLFKSANGAQHSIGMSFRSSPESSGRLLGEMFGPSIETAKRLRSRGGVAFFADQVDALKGQCVEETVYLVLFTHPGGLSGAERERAIRWREDANQRARKGGADVKLDDSYAQNPRPAYSVIYPRHTSAVRNLLLSLQNSARNQGGDLLVRKLDCGEAANLMRRMQDTSNFPATWRPRMLGDKGASASVAMPRRGDDAHVMPMRIGRQMVTEKYTEIAGDVEMAKRGGTYFASVVLEVMPEEGSAVFADLTTRIGRAIPWTMSVEVGPNGTEVRKLDQMYAGFVGAFGDYNKSVRRAWDDLKRIHKSSYVAATRVIFTTWADSEQRCVENCSFLKSCIESWGSCVVTNETGAPALAALGQASGFCKRSPAPFVPAPLAEFTRMLPLFRSASVWSDGQLIAHTEEGRPYPVKFGTKLQPFWGAVVFAPSGMGKSFILNMTNVGIAFSPGSQNLPYVVVVDVGPSSKLVMDYVRSTLPPEMRGQVVSLRIRNDRKYAVNCFDTQLGCDRPTEVDKDFQVCVLSTMAPSLGNEGDKFISMVIDEAYKMFSRKSPEQREWSASFDESLNAALSSIGFEVKEKTRVYDVVDAFFGRGMVNEAVKAQRYAVPTLPDLVTAARRRSIQDMWGDAVTPSGESMIEVFCRSIIAGANEYKLLNGYTQFDIGAARMISVDLEEVVGSELSEEGRRRSALMFMFARRLGAKNYFLRWEELEDIVAPAYRQYQEQRVKEIAGELKFLEYDEKHYTRGIAAFDLLVERDLRVGRKYRTVTLMASQMLDDFPKAVVENCYSFFILGVGTNTSAHELANRFGLSDSELDAVVSKCTGPGRMFARFKTTSGVTSQILCTTAGPMAKWAFTTSSGDKEVRAELLAALGEDRYSDVVSMLARAYPEGSCRDEMDAFKRSMKASANTGGKTVEQIFAARLLAQRDRAVAESEA